MRAGLLPPGTGAVVGRRLTPEPERELPTDPVAWAQEHGYHLWSKQREVARSVIENRRTMVPACHGPGKSFLAGFLAAYWIASHPIGEALVVSSAPLQHQVNTIVWKNLAGVKQVAGLPGTITGLKGNATPEWHVGPPGAETLVGFGRKPADLKNLDQARQAFQGQHARYILVILDEATGIPSWLWEAADSLLSNEAARILAIGNPDDAASQFAKECDSPDANVIRISAWDTPAFTGEWVPEYLKELLTSRVWVEERVRKWGRDSPLFKSKVDAQFPDTSDTAVITPAMIQAAWMRDLPGNGPGAYGLDVARMGEDETVLARVRDGVARVIDAWGKTDTVATRKRVMAHVRATPAVPVVVDADGLGAGVYDQLREHKVYAVPFTLNTAARNPRRFFDRRSEMWWDYRELMEQGLVDLDRDDTDLAAQLQQPRWSLTSKGKIKVETKEEMEKRGLPSPDRADAVIMAEVGAPVHVGTGYGSPGSGPRPPRTDGKDRSPTADLLRRPM